MPPQKRHSPGTSEPSARRRSGRIGSSGTKSQYFEADSDDEHEDDVANSAPRNVAIGSGKKRGRPAKNATPSSASRGRKRAKLESDKEDGDDYKEDDDGDDDDDDEDDDGDGDEYKEDDFAAESDKDVEEEDEDDEDEDAPPRVTFIPHVKLREPGGVSYEDDRLHKNTLLFLKDLKANNVRSWLKANDKEFRRAQSDWHTYVETLTHKVIAIDPTIPELPVKDVVMRIYRDIRFSHDPTPYRPFFSAAFSRTGRKGPYACYYVHCEPGATFLGGGLWMPDAAALAKLRASIDRHPARWRTALADEGLRKAFFGRVNKGDVDGCVKAFCKANKESALKTKPRDYPADHANIELLKLRSFTIARKSLPESVLTVEDGQDQIAHLVRAMVGFVTFLNDIVMPDPSADSESSSDEDEDGHEDEEDAGQGEAVE